MENLKSIIPHNFQERFEKICGINTYQPAILPKVERIVVFGDIHGDLKLLLTLLKISKVVEFENYEYCLRNIKKLKIKEIKFKWIGGKTHIVQVGDQVDRCRKNGKGCKEIIEIDDEGNDELILLLCNKIHKKAQKVGGAFISLLGNHELMNASGDVSWVSRQGILKYVDVDNGETYEMGEEKRREAFKPTGEIGTLLGCTRLPSVIIGNNLFVHAGIINQLLEEMNITEVNDLEIINKAIRGWLLGMINKDYVEKIINGSNSMFWTRLLGQLDSDISLKDSRCQELLSNVFTVFKNDNLIVIVGHTPQSFIKNKSLNGTCDNHVWRVDIGSSKAFNLLDKEYETEKKISNNRRPQVLEILNDEKYNILD